MPAICGGRSSSTCRMRSMIIVVNVPDFHGGVVLLLAGVFVGVEQFFGEDAVVAF